MPHYSVIQYVPDPVTDERMNVGVVVFGDDVVLGRFLKNWRRARNFGEEDLGFLRDLESRVARWAPPDLELPGLEDKIHLDAEQIRGLSGKWINSIQFTEPRGSTLDASELLQDVAARFLRDKPRRTRGFRDRRAAAKIARDAVRDSLSRLGSLPHVKADNNASVKGRLDEHRLDVAVSNGHLLLAAQGLSFEGHASRQLQREIDATAWTIDDIRSANEGVALAILALPPKTGASKAHSKAMKIFEGLGATMLDEGKIDEWTEERLRALLRLG